MRTNQEKTLRLKIAYLSSDWLTTNVAIFLFNVFRYHFFDEINFYFTLWEYISSPTVLAEQIIIPFALLGVYWISGYYNKLTEKSRLQEIFVTAMSALFNAIVIYLLMLINDFLGKRTLSYELLLVLTGLLFFCTYLGRLTITSIVRAKFRSHIWEHNVVIAGAVQHLKKINQKLNEESGDISYVIKGFYATNSRPEDADRYLSFEELKTMAENNEIDQIVIASRTNNEAEVLHLLSVLFPLNVAIKIFPDYLSFVTPSIRLGNVYGHPMIDLTSPAMSDFQTNVKRVIDVSLSSIALILLAPVIGAVALAVKISDGKGPVFYSQERIGLHQQTFKIIKFRSMKTNAESKGPQLSSDDDPRVTPIGRFLRKYRIDEIPQFWNVIKGDMSLVGPRPERRFFIEKIEKRMPQYTLLQQVRPGITSWGMVKYGYARNIDEMLKRAKFDMIYLSNMSLLMDVKIMIHTVRTIVTGKGV
ncbi:MAG: sugar transferase [Muribaculum sp.]|nr:sugar transferase [Muribaculum sp.]